MRKISKLVTAQITTALLLLASASLVQAQMAPQAVADNTYAGIQYIHGFRATPRLYFGVRPGRVLSSCGPVYGSLYCAPDHALFITTNHIAMAYQHGDAALAYVIAHEYAHAMQMAFGLMPRRTSTAELQADCLAGVYLGSLPNLRFDRSDLIEVATLAHRLGDHSWGRGHHGTPRQRMNAVVQGLEAGKLGLEGVRACMS